MPRANDNLDNTPNWNRLVLFLIKKLRVTPKEGHKEEIRGAK